MGVAYLAHVHMELLDIIAWKTSKNIVQVAMKSTSSSMSAACVVSVLEELQVRVALKTLDNTALVVKRNTTWETIMCAMGRTL